MNYTVFLPFTTCKYQLQHYSKELLDKVYKHIIVNSE